MSFRLSGRVFALDISANEKLVLRALADHANGDGTSCYPSVRKLMEETSLSRRTVQTTLRSLAGKELLVHIGPSKGGRGHTPEYLLTLDKAQSGTPRPSPKVKQKTKLKGAGGAPFPEQQRAQELLVKGAKSDAERAQNEPIKGAARAPDSKVFTLSFDSINKSDAISSLSEVADSSPNTPADSDTTASERAFSAFGFAAPFGHPRFTDAVIRSAEKIQNGNTLELMESVIVELDGKVPPPWYARKHSLETIAPETSVAQPQSPKSYVEEVQGHCAAVLSLFHHAAEKFPAIAQTLNAIASTFERSVAAACNSPHGFDVEALETEIQPLDEEVLRLLATAAGNEMSQRLRHSVQTQLARMKIRADQLGLVEGQYFQKRLLDAFGLPRLSLYYMLRAPATTPSSEINNAAAPCEVEFATEPWWPKSLDEAVDFVFHASPQPIDGDAWLRARSRAHRKTVQFRNRTGEFRRPEKRRQFIELLKRGAQRMKANAAARAKRKERRANREKQTDIGR